jgi:hypothetical protein
VGSVPDLKVLNFDETGGTEKAKAYSYGRYRLSVLLIFTAKKEFGSYLFDSLKFKIL